MAFELRQAGTLGGMMRGSRLAGAVQLRLESDELVVIRADEPGMALDSCIQRGSLQNLQIRSQCFCSVTSRTCCVPYIHIQSHQGFLWTFATTQDVASLQTFLPCSQTAHRHNVAACTPAPRLRCA